MAEPEKGVLPTAAAGQVSPEEQQEPKFAGKYNTVEELEAGYEELQKKLGSQNTQETEQQTQTQDPVQPIQNTPSLDSYYQEYQTTGQLKPESVKAISEQYGIPEEIVQTHMAGVKALAEQTLSQGYARVGGEEAYQAMTQWATVNNPNAVTVANNAIARGDTQAWLMALDSIRTSYESALGRDPSNSGPPSKTASGEPGFASRQELIHAIQKKGNDGYTLYEKDPEYRRKVQERLANSSFVGQ